MLQLLLDYPSHLLATDSVHLKILNQKLETKQEVDALFFLDNGRCTTVYK